MKKAILVALDYKDEDDFAMSLSELKGLCKACDIEYTKVIVQSITPTKPYYMGKGKVNEVKRMIDDEEMVIVGEELTPLQVRNLTEELGLEVTDRTDLILRIFASRAKTKEAKLQVEIARLNYELPRLAGMHEGIYSQQGGSGFRGAGETQLEIDRRRIHHQIATAKKELARLKKERQIQRQRRMRNQEEVVCLVGYTNSGKSSLMNLYTQKKVSAQDMLFATLETSTRRIRLADKKYILLSDTVGFISHLPHHLIEAFLSTLEEVKEADLILMVIDCSAKYVQKQIDVTLDTLQQLGVDRTPILYVYNKEDLPHDDLLVTRDPHVFISVKNETHIEEMEEEILRLLAQDEERVAMVIPYNEGEVYNTLKQRVHIIEESFPEDGIHLIVEVTSYYKNKYAKYIKMPEN